MVNARNSIRGKIMATAALPTVKTPTNRKSRLLINKLALAL